MKGAGCISVLVALAGAVTLSAVLAGSPPSAAPGAAAPTAVPPPVVVELETELGPIELSLDAAAAPVSVANFLRYVDGGLYDGARFHRTVRREPDNQPQNVIKIEVIQAGVDSAREAQSFPPIALERTRDTGLSHQDGTVSMARAAPDTASGDFFVCIGDQPELDFGGRRNPDGQGFAAFGRVTRGMHVVRAIHQADANGQRLDPPVRIRSARRRPAAEVEAHAVLDAWHAAAAAANEEAYFAHLAEGAVFMGTDATERWDREAFRAWAKPIFARGKAWSFRAIERRLRLGPHGDVAWFDEVLDTPNLGPARGSGVLVATDVGWRIAHYDLSVPIPNPIFDEVRERIARFLAGDGTTPAAP